MKWKFSVLTINLDGFPSFKKFDNYSQALDYAFRCEDDLNIVYVEFKIIMKGDCLSYES